MENEKKNGQLSQKDLSAVSGGRFVESQPAVDLGGGSVGCPSCGKVMAYMGGFDLWSDGGWAFKCDTHGYLYKRGDGTWYKDVSNGR